MNAVDNTTQISDSVRNHPTYGRLVDAANAILENEVGDSYPELRAVWEFDEHPGSSPPVRLTLRDGMSAAVCTYPTDLLEDSRRTRRALNQQWREVINQTVHKLRQRVDETFRQPVEV